jgi:hypothetical protein
MKTGSRKARDNNQIERAVVPVTGLARDGGVPDGDCKARSAPGPPAGDAYVRPQTSAESGLAW